MELYLIPVVLVVMVVIAVSGAASAKKRRRRELSNRFGSVHSTHVKYVMDSVSVYNNYRESVCTEELSRLDAATWSDLDMDEVFKRVSRAETSVGDEYIYSLLHETEPEPGRLEARERLIARFDSDEELRLNVSMLLSSVGRADYSRLSDFFTPGEIAPLPFPALYTVCTLLPPVLLLLTVFFPLIFGVPFIASLALNGVLHYRAVKLTEQRMPTFRYLSSVIRAARSLCGYELPSLEGLPEAVEALRRVMGSIAPMTLRGGELEFLLEYLRIFSLSDERGFNRAIAIISAHPTELEQVFRALGEVEAAISVLSFRSSLPEYCIPETVEGRGVSFKDIYHPLITGCVTNSAELSRSSLITGSNASGKSTFVKAVAVNTILAQTINTCCAASLSLPRMQVISSMAMRDSIVSGDSYFVTEIRSLYRILNAAKCKRCLCLVDEILRGTNTIERIAASCAVLEYLARTESLCLVASHDIELTALLSGAFDNYHFREKITENGVEFDYLLKNGPAQSRNAIRLLGFMGFPRTVTARSDELVEHFETTGGWL